MNKKIALVLLLFLLPCIVSAETLESYNIDFQIVDDYVSATIQYNFLSSSNKDLTVVLPSDAWSISLVIDNKELAPNIADNKVKLPLTESTKKARLTFYTKEMLDYNQAVGVFFTDVIAPFDSKSIKTTLSLPAGSSLTKPAEEANAKPTRVESNGQYITLVWENKDISKNSKISSLAVFNIEEPGIFSNIKTNIILAVCFNHCFST